MVVRADPLKPREFERLQPWNGVDMRLDVFRPKDPQNPDGGDVARSFSGHERNRLFIQTDENFQDTTLVSGADFPKDSRSFVLLDYDGDGWLDIGVTSPLSPRFQVFRNTLGDHQANSNGSVFVSLQGGNDGPEAQLEWSARDAYGAKFLVTVGETRQMHQNSCSEGLASQNSKWNHVGLGKAKRVDRIQVTWPSGKQTTHEDIAAGSRVTLHENGRTDYQD